MNRDDIDWTILRTPLIIFCIVLAISIFIIVSSYFYLEVANEQFQSNNSKFRNISKKYLQVDEEEEFIQEYYPQFVDIYRAGLLGKEKRLDWIEAMQNVSENLEIPSLRYEIASQEIYPNDMGISTGKYQIYQSPMTLKMDMIHELDLIRFIDRVDRQAVGYFTISQCTIERNNMEIDSEELNKNISADCRFNWLNIKMSNGEDIVL